MFLILVDNKNKDVYWSSVEANNREGRFGKNNNTASLVVNDYCDFSEMGLNIFLVTYLKEKRWSDVENAIEKSIMSYNTLGPLVLMCKRQKDNAICSSTIQYLLIQHYEYFTILSRYLLGKKVEYLPYWYQKHVTYLQNNKSINSPLFTFKTLKEMIDYFIWGYIDCIKVGYKLITEDQKEYFLERMPYLYIHLTHKPHTFITDDWAARYYFDEYENETKSPENLFFDDFDEFG